MILPGGRWLVASPSQATAGAGAKQRMWVPLPLSFVDFADQNITEIVSDLRWLKSERRHIKKVTRQS